MGGRPSWALGWIALGLALAAAGCSAPSAPKGESPQSAAVQAGADPDEGRLGSRVDRADAAPAPGAARIAMNDTDGSGDPAASSEPPLPSTQRDERTLNADHPYRDRHGLANCELDCSVHEAGYKWAALHSLRDARFCAGRTEAFVDGCRAYVGDHRG